MGCRLLTVAVVLFCWALPLQARESVELEFSAGRVNLTAQNASARTILAEWARLGGATIVNGDNTGGPPLTLELVAVPGAPRPTLRRPPVIGRQPQTGLGVPIGGGAGSGASSGVTVFDPLGDQGGEEFDPQQSGNPGLIPQPFVRRPPDQSGSGLSDPGNMIDSGVAQGEASPAGVAPTPSNPFGVPFGSSAMPGVVTPAPQ